MCFSHFPVNFRLWNESCDRIDNNNINGTTSYKCFCNLQRLFARIRLGNYKVFDVNANCFCIYGIKGMLRINKSSFTAKFLSFCNGMKSKGCFT